MWWYVMVVAWRWRSDEDDAIEWWHFLMVMTVVRRQWVLILVFPFMQFVTNDWPVMDPKHMTELNFLKTFFLAMPTFWQFCLSFCSSMLSEDTPHFVILGYSCILFHHDNIDGFLYIQDSKDFYNPSCHYYLCLLHSHFSSPKCLLILHNTERSLTRVWKQNKNLYIKVS